MQVYQGVPPSMTDSRTTQLQRAVTDSRTSSARLAMTATSTPRSLPVVTDSSTRRSPPAVTDLSTPPPSYGSVIVIPSSAPHDTADDGLPTYEHVLIDIVERVEN